MSIDYFSEECDTAPAPPPPAAAAIDVVPFDRHVLGVVLEIWVLIFLNLVMFAWLGMVLFAGTDEGDAVFPDMFEAGWRLFVLFTTTNFPDIM